MNSFYVSTSGPEDWRWLLANPALHWRHGASAMALADAWERAQGWPAPVAAALATDPHTSNLEILVGLPEHRVPLPGGARASQTDLFVLARQKLGGLVALAVEGKVEEPFGDTVAEWRQSGGPGKADRLAYLCSTLDLEDDATLGPIRYQLIHRTASAVIEARRFGAPHAAMIVHSFSPAATGFQDFEQFASLLGAKPAKGAVSHARSLGDADIHLGWVGDSPSPAAPQPPLSGRTERAFALARELHSDQRRKGTEVPYMSHLLGVASLVLEDGGDEDETIAALLHDAVEDQGGDQTLRRIRRLFGSRVASIVSACSDTDATPKPPWRARKESYIKHLADADLPDGAIRVSLADKLHNARTMLLEVRAGRDVFARFTVGYDDQRWYYKTITEAFAKVSTSPMVAELRSVVSELFSRAERAPSG